MLDLFGHYCMSQELGSVKMMAGDTTLSGTMAPLKPVSEVLETMYFFFNVRKHY